MFENCLAIRHANVGPNTAPGSTYAFKKKTI